MLTRYQHPQKGSPTITEGLPPNYYILQGLQNPSDKGKLTVHVGNALVPLLIHETGKQLTINDL